MSVLRNTEDRDKITIPLLSFSVFIFSLIVGPFYVAGDQIVYRMIYEGLKSRNLTEGFLFYHQNISSLEFTHYFLSWLACRIFDKDLFIALSNSILAYSALILLRKYRASILVAGLLVLTNYYMMALYFPAERLKFGIIFLFLSLVYAERLKLFYLFAFIAVISHIQVVIAYGCIGFLLFTKAMVRLFKSGRISIKYLLVIPAGIIPLALMSDQLVNKFNMYYYVHDMTNLLRALVFFALALWYSKNRTETTLLFIPLLVAVQLVGGHRVNMFGYYIFLYYALRVRSGFNLGVLVTSTYFLYNSIIFVYRVINFGDAYYEP